MSTSSSGGTTNHSTNPTTAKHQLVSAEGFLRPLEGLPEGVTKLVIYVGGSKDKLREVLGVCERINNTKNCTDLGTLQRVILVDFEQVEYLIFNYRKVKTFTYLSAPRFYDMIIHREEYYEVSYNLFIEKLRWAERALLFQDYVEAMD